MSFSIKITGILGEIDDAIHKQIHELAAKFAAELHDLEGTKVESAVVTTHDNTSDVTPKPAVAVDPVSVGTESGATATVTGDGIATGTHVHPNTPGSPPKGPK